MQSLAFLSGHSTSAWITLINLLSIHILSSTCRISLSATKTDLSSSLFLLLILIKFRPSPLELFTTILHISENLSYTFTTFFVSLPVVLPSIFTSSELVNHQLYSSLLHLFQSDKNHHLYCYFYSKYLPSSWTDYFSRQ